MSSLDSPPGELLWALRALCLTEIISWGVLYYAFPVLVDTIADRQGWSHLSLNAAFSLGLIVSASAGIAVGRLMQRHGPRWLMTGASVLAVAAMLVVATAPTLWMFAVGWVVAGVAMSGTLYAPAFAAVTVWFGSQRLRALTAITLIAGLASPIFAPLTAALNHQLGWRYAYLVLAIGLGAVTIPAHAFALRAPWPDLRVNVGGPGTAGAVPESGPGRGASDGLDHARVSPVLFALLSAAFSFSTLGVYAAVINLVPLMVHRGCSPTAASLVLGVGGVGQVLGRLGCARLFRLMGIRARTVAVLTSTAFTTGLLGVVPAPLWLLTIVSVAAGTARGVFTLIQATAVSDRWGATHYARLNGVFGAPIMIASALAPFIGAGLAAGLDSYPASYVLLAALGLVAACLVGSRSL